MTQYKTTRKILIIFVIAALISILNQISYALYYTIWLKQNVKSRTNDSSNEDIQGVHADHFRILPVNISNNWKILYNSIICGNNAPREGNVSNKTEPAENHVVKDGLYYYFQNYEAERNELCPLIPPNLGPQLSGPVPGDKSIVGLYGIENMYIEIVTGGIHSPSACIARQNAAIIVPIHETNKRMKSYLASFIFYMHPFLMKQLLEYQIFVIYKLNASLPYKRGELYNMGFEVAQTKRPEGWQCVIFHDAYLVPEDTRNLYRCAQHPRRLIADSRKPHRFGGAVALTPEQFIASNGFSNLAWNEDDDYIDMYRRLILANFSVETNVPNIGKYAPLEYLKQINYNLTRKQTPVPLQSKDGFDDAKLKIETVQYQQLYTLVTVTD